MCFEFEQGFDFLCGHLVMVEDRRCLRVVRAFSPLFPYLVCYPGRWPGLGWFAPLALRSCVRFGRCGLVCAFGATALCAFGVTALYLPSFVRVFGAAALCALFVAAGLCFRPKS